MFVPVVDSEQRPLMPTTPSRARKWIRSGKATPFWKRGVFCVRLNQEPSDRIIQDVVVGIDPGSKREGFSIKSEHHTYLNVQTHAVDWVKKKMEQRSQMRRSRRFRNTPCRQPRFNRARGGLVPSTKARWQWKLRICCWLEKMFPISMYVVEDIKAWTKQYQRRWNKSFSPLEVGKNWFYKQLDNVMTKQGYQTKICRDELGLKKSSQKLSSKFEAHCVDSWVLANSIVGGHTQPDNTNLLEIIPIQTSRRQLHRFQTSKKWGRSRYGGTNCLGLKKGSLVEHNKYGLMYVSGQQRNQVQLNVIETGKQKVLSKLQNIKFLTYNSWRCAFIR